MIRKNGWCLFGAIQGGAYKYGNDTKNSISEWTTILSIPDIIEHIKSLEIAYKSGLGGSLDVFTGEHYPAAIYRDGHFVLPADILRYLERGDIRGIPKEYEDYLINQCGLVPIVS